MSKARDAVVSALVLLVGRGRRTPRKEVLRVLPERSADARAELLAIALLFVGALGAVAFVVVYAIDSLPRHTQLLGVSLGVSLLAIAAALIVTGKRLVVTEELVEEYPPDEHPHEQELLGQLVDESADGLTRRRFFKLGLGAAGGALGLAAIAPALSFGPLIRVREFYDTPWRKGRRLVDELGRPWKASDIEPLDLYTAFPEGADKEEQGSAVVLVRLPAAQLDLPAELSGYDAGGIVAYSKLCTHAGCAISMYRAPLFQPDEPRPALVCPCHYSTFDPADGGSVKFGPAGRRLPMLPIEVDAHGHLRAQGNFDDAVGASWWGVRNRRPSP